MPVVSQSIIRPIVPVGASTEAWELRTPMLGACSQASSHASCAASRTSRGTGCCRSRSRPPVLREHLEHRLAVLVEAGERAHAGRGRADVA